MTKIYHFSNQLILMDKVYKMDKYDTMQKALLRELRGSIKIIYDAHEIWFYNNQTKAFESYKNKSGTSTILAAYLEDNGINIRCDAAAMTGLPIRMRFLDKKDEFLFNLKF